MHVEGSLIECYTVSTKHWCYLLKLIGDVILGHKRDFTDIYVCSLLSLVLNFDVNMTS